MGEKSVKDENGSSSQPDSSNTASSNGNTESNGLQSTKLFLITCGISVSYFLVLLNSTVVVTTIPSITSSFNSTQDVGWYGSAYLLTSCTVQPLSGKIYTFHSLKYTFLSFMAIFELGSLLCGVATSSPMFIVGRAIAGLGAAGITNGAMTIVAATAPRPKRPYIIGFAMAIGSMGQVTGPLVGGALTQYVSWRWTPTGFYINLPLGGATALLLLFIDIPEQRHKAKGKLLGKAFMQLDPIGFAAVSPSVVMLLLALNWGGNIHPWKSATIIGLLCGAFASLCIFIVWEWRKEKDAMIPFYMLRHPIIASCLLTGFLQSGAIVEMTYFLPIWFQAVRGDSATMSGVNLMATVGSQIFFAAVTGLLGKRFFAHIHRAASRSLTVVVSRVGYPLPFAEFGSFCLAIGAGLMSTLVPSTNTGRWVGFQILTGAGRGIVQQLPIGVVQAVLTGDEVAVGSSLLAFVQYLGAAVFISSANSLFSNKLVSSLHSLAPEINPTDVIKGGATELRSAFPSKHQSQLLLAYNDAITDTFYLAAAAGAATALTSLGIGFINVKKERAAREA